MPERRTDDETALVTEYALFLSQTRGMAAGLAYFDSCKVAKGILLRASHSETSRRRYERRRENRN